MHSDTDLLDQSSSERLLSRAPIVIRRSFEWDECDPAGVVYTPQHADYAASTFQWFLHVLLRPALADDSEYLTFEVGPSIMMIALEMDESPRFRCRVIPIIIDRDTFTRVDIPRDAKTATFPYKEAHDRK